MSHVINSNERNQAFFKFLAFFTITVSLVVCATYVDFRGLPLKKKKLLEAQFETIRANTLDQQQFVQHMQKARLLLDSLHNAPKNRNQVESALTLALNDMESFKKRDTSINGKLNEAVLMSFMELHELKKEVENLRKLPGKVDSLNLKLDEKEALLDTYRTRAQQYPTQ